MYKIVGIVLLTLFLSTSFCLAFMDYNAGLPLEEQEDSVQSPSIEPNTQVPPAGKTIPAKPVVKADLSLPLRQIQNDQPAITPDQKQVNTLPLTREIQPIRSEAPTSVSSTGNQSEQPNNFTADIVNKQIPATLSQESSAILPVSPSTASSAATHSPGLANMSTHGLIGYGSGFFVTPDIIATNWHVVRDFDRLEVLHLGIPLKATVIAKDENNDLALLQIHNYNVSRKVNPLPIIDIRKVNAGERVYAVGFPDPNRLGFRPKITDGLINSVAGEHDNPTCFQISTAIQPGNSGGPLINSHGQVVGIISKRWTTKQYQNVSYAVKSSHLVNLLLSLPEGIIIPEEPVFANPVDGADIMLLARDAVVTIVRRSID